MNLNDTIQEKFLFFHKFLNSPKQIGSVTPSSPFLCKTMIRSIQWHQVRTAAELGPGTGALTKYIDKVKSKDTRVLLFEKDPHLRDQLGGTYPDFPCYAEACQLEAALQAEGIPALDCILSGLPFFNFPQELRDQLLTQIHASLKPGGLFVAFQYSTQMKKQLASYFDIREVRFVPLNIPPAFVYICRK